MAPPAEAALGGITPSGYPDGPGTTLGSAAADPAAAAATASNPLPPLPLFQGEDYEERLREELRKAIHGPCVLDVREENILSYSLGDWGLIERDLRAALPSPVANLLEECLKPEVLDGLAVRRELINYKKVCLHLWQASLVVEKDLRQLSSFFYSPTAELRNRYNEVSSTMNECRGATAALHDARYFGKAICGLPRHPDSGVPWKFEQLPESLEVWKLMEQARQFLRDRKTLDAYWEARWNRWKGSGADADGGSVADQNREQAQPELVETAPTEAEQEVGEVGSGHGPAALDKKPEKKRFPWTSERQLVPSELATGGLGRLMRSMEALELQLPAAATNYVRLVLVARGAAKALAIRAALARYIEALRVVTKECRALADMFRELLDQPASESEISAGLHLHAEKHWRTLQGANNVLPEMLRWLEPISAASHGSERLFVSGAKGATAFVPRGFADLLGPFRRIAEPHRIAMIAQLVEHGWPRSARPSPEQEVHVHPCRRCGDRCTKLWLHRGLCLRCEDATRAEGRCPFSENCGSRSFCPHARRCVVCEQWPCEECRLLRGDGEDVWQLVEQLQPAMVFLDFDRTLATTKAGNSPLEGFHTVDPDLAAVCAGHPGRAQVVTRSSRKEDILTFLAMKDVPVKHVHSLKRDGWRKKAEVIAKQLDTAAIDAKDGPPVGLFVDDDIKELTDPALAALVHEGRLHRLLFVRNGGKP